MPEEDIVLAEKIWQYMRLEPPLEKADVIIGLGSHDMQTPEWCARLYNDGYAPVIVFCGGRGRLTEDLVGNEADQYADRAISLGVPEQSILRDTNSTNTGENIVNAYRILKEKDLLPGKVLLVTKPYMLRRAYATFMKQWPGEVKPEVTCSAIDKSFRDYGSGFEDMKYTTEVMVGDLQRIKEYPALGFQIEQDIPDDIWATYKELVARGYTSQLMK